MAAMRARSWSPVAFLLWVAEVSAARFRFAPPGLAFFSAAARRAAISKNLAAPQ